MVNKIINSDSIDIADIGIEWMIAETRKSKDVSLLTIHLRDYSSSISPDLRELIAELLEQKYKSKKLSKFSHLRGLLIGRIDATKDYLSGTYTLEDISWEEYILILKNKYGIDNEYFDKKGDITKAAELIVAKMFNLTISQLDEIIRPRKSREKYRK